MESTMEALEENTKNDGIISQALLPSQDDEISSQFRSKDKNDISTTPAQSTNQSDVGEAPLVNTSASLAVQINLDNDQEEYNDSDSKSGSNNDPSPAFPTMQVQNNEEEYLSPTPPPLLPSTPPPSSLTPSHPLLVQEKEQQRQQHEQELLLSLEDQAGCISTWLLGFLNPLLSLGAKKTLTTDDIGVPSKQDLAYETYQNIHEKWEQELKRYNYFHGYQQDEHTAVGEKEQQEQEEQQGKESHDDSKTKTKEKSKFPDHHNKQQQQKQPSIVGPLLASFGHGKLILAFLYYLVAVMLNFLPILILNDLVRFFEEYDGEGGDIMKEWDGYLSNPWIEVAGLCVIPLLSSTLETRHQAIMAHARVFLRSAVSSLVYQKCLRVSPSGRAATSTGQVVNMMSNDVNQMQKFLEVAGLTAVAPIQIVVAVILIYQQVGRATWVGVGYMVFLMPTTAVVVAIAKRYRQEVIRYSDMRVRLMNELLTGIRIIKFYAWERPFGLEVAKFREQEMKALTKLSYVSAIGFSFLVISAPIIQPILVFATYAKIENDKPLSASTAFTTVALFNIMRFPFVFMPISLVQYVQCTIALKRVARYLLLPELSDYVKNEHPPQPPTLLDDDNSSNATGNSATRNEDYAVTIINGSFGWGLASADEGEVKDSPSAEENIIKASDLMEVNDVQSEQGDDMNNNNNNTNNKVSDTSSSTSHNSAIVASSSSSFTSSTKACLTNINCRIPEGKLTAIVGPVGSGKTSFLAAIMGEMEAIGDSKIYIPNSTSTSSFLSYCAQTPWVTNDTIQGNITFGKPFDKTLYQKVLFDCALLDDLKLFSAGDQTEIGERGINLSGGQKARVSLARALYSSLTNHKNNNKVEEGVSSRTTTTQTMILLDDPLSAVDPQVCDHLFAHAIHGVASAAAAESNISRTTTRILVTHQVHYLPQCDHIIVLGDGRIQHQGTYVELVQQGVDFYSTVRKDADTDDGEHNDKETILHPIDSSIQEDEAIAVGNKSKYIVGEKEQGKIPTENNDKNIPITGNDSPIDNTNGNIPSTSSPSKSEPEAEKVASKLIQDEEQGEGSVEGAAYIHYMRAGGTCIAVSILIIQAIGRGLEIGSAFWLAAWSEVGNSGSGDESFSSSKSSLSDEETSFYVGIYAMLGMLGITAVAFRGILLANHRLNASVKLHSDLTDSILNAPISFFDVTPIGRILNRFAADMDKTDLELTQFLTRGIDAVFNVLGSICAIVAATRGIFLIPLIPLSIFYFWAQNWFRKTSTDLQRLTKISTSPIFADFSQTLSGTPTIRAYHAEQMFFQRALKNFDRLNSSYLLTQLVGYWLALRLDILGGLISAFIGIIALSTQFIPAGWLGLSLSYSMEITTYLKYVVQMVANIEGEMSSVERILYYSHHVDQEKGPRRRLVAPGDEKEGDPKKKDNKDNKDQNHDEEMNTVVTPADNNDWPSHGALSFQNVTMRYREGLPLVLKGLTFDVMPGEKIGICGRTGSGKSSIMIALFRICELAGGSIHVDDVDISSIDLETLRSNMAIIPQDPILFSNTIRFNLNPNHRPVPKLTSSSPSPSSPSGVTKNKNDNDDSVSNNNNDNNNDNDKILWDILEKVQMANVIKAMPNGLDSMVTEGGENFSQGQRQLICIARALLRHPKLLVMDEATASIDNQTDALVQEMIAAASTKSKKEKRGHNEHEGEGNERDDDEEEDEGQHVLAANCTILTIAHRLNTILQSDRILVLNDGQVAEFDTPKNLLQNTESLFYQLVQASEHEDEEEEQEKQE